MNAYKLGGLFLAATLSLTALGQDTTAKPNPVKTAATKTATGTKTAAKDTAHGTKVAAKDTAARHNCCSQGHGQGAPRQ